MKTFKSAEWDSDATGDSTYQELFKGNRKKKKSKPISTAYPGEIDGNKEKKKLQGILQKLKEMESNNLVKVQDPRKLFKKSKNDNQETTKLISSGIKRSRSGLEEDSSRRKKRKHYKSLDNSDDEDSGISKKQKRMVKKYSAELDVLNRDKDRLHEELLKEKKRQLELKKKQLILHKIIELKKSNTNNHTSKSKISELQIKSHDSDHMTKKMEQNRRVTQQSSSDHINRDIDPLELRKKKKMLEKLKTVVQEKKAMNTKPAAQPALTLRQRMMEKLKAARFRFLNEQIYTTNSKEAQKIFKSDPEAFTAYHEGYQQQVRSWPLNPLDVIIKSIQKMPKHFVVADFGCGDAKLARSVEQRVHSFDLVAVDDTVIACDMANVPLKADSIDVAVFCLSLMGTNLHDYLLEANRVLKVGGILKIAEVESRFDKVDIFIEGVTRFGFKKTWKDLTRNLFYFMDFKKHSTVKNRKKLPTISLQPCLYKRR